MHRMHETYLMDICNHMKNGCVDAEGSTDAEKVNEKPKKKSQKEIFYLNLKSKKKEKNIKNKKVKKK